MYIKLSAKATRDYGAKETRSRQFIRRQLINKNGATCALCGKSIETMKDCTIDHIVPISKGGWVVCYDYLNKKVDCFDSIWNDSGEPVRYATKEEALKSIKENEADWKKYFGIKEN